MIVCGRHNHRHSIVAAVIFLVLIPRVYSQGTMLDYQHAHDLAMKSRNLVLNVPGPVNWIGNTDHFWYAKSVEGGNEFILVDATRTEKKSPFDHDKLAAAITRTTGHVYTGLTLPFVPKVLGALLTIPTTSPLTFLNDERSIQFGTRGLLYRCSLDNYTCASLGPIPLPVPDTRGDASGDCRRLVCTWSPTEPDSSVSTSEVNSPATPEDAQEKAFRDPVEGIDYQPQSHQTDEAMHIGSSGGCALSPLPPPPRIQAPAAVLAAGSEILSQLPQVAPKVCLSFDGKYEAFVQDFNVVIREKGQKLPYILTLDGSENNYYAMRTFAWSPDSKKLVAYRIRPGLDREVLYIDSSPTDQIEPKHTTIHYLRPGDTVDIASPVLFDIDKKEQIGIDHALFPNPYAISLPVWWKDSRGFTFEYNQRGHQVYTVIEVNANTGKTRPLITEQTKTFFYYRNLSPGLVAGRRYRYDVNDGKEIIWASERDGWEHLYLYDGVTGKVKNQITKGNWLVRNVDYVDTENRQIWFETGGIVPGQDPYFTQLYRINFDGTGLTKLTDADGTHTVTFSQDRKYYVDMWQRVDLAPVAQLRRSADQKILMDIEKGDTSALLAAGFKFPEVFVAKGRDGQTDIWGTITRPLNFDPSKKYPVIENIYAGPQGSYVPKTFSAVAPDQALAELGFIVVHIDGMGTSNRSKAFQDVAYKNLADAGFPDRILWHKAVASKYPYYDISRVGIFGTSSGGQNSLAALLFHPEFYKVAVSNSGCHDNRLDKIGWTEQWMGWPVGPQYLESSNVVNAYRLQGKVLIIAGELDTNVNAANSLQVVNALVKARKHFDMLYIPGQNHGVISLADQHYLEDYFVKNLLGIEPPNWNKVSLQSTAQSEK